MWISTSSRVRATPSLEIPPVGWATTMGLQRFEQRLERMVEGAFSKALRGGIQPVEIGRRLTREMDLLRRVGVRGLIAPNVFVVTLSPQDADRFQSFADVLARELGDAARDHARSEGYVFVGPVEVEIRSDPSTRAGRYRVTAEVREGLDGLAAARSSCRTDPGSCWATRRSRSAVSPNARIALSDPNVSRRHAEVRRHGSDVVVADLQSTNGTRVNGVPVRERVLEDGDEITVGTTAIRFETS